MLARFLWVDIFPDLWFLFLRWPSDPVGTANHGSADRASRLVWDSSPVLAFLGRNEEYTAGPPLPQIGGFVEFTWKYPMIEKTAWFKYWLENRGKT